MSCSKLSTAFRTLGFCLVFAATVGYATPISLQPLLYGKWPTNSMQTAITDVKVAGRYAYLVDEVGGFHVIDVSNPTQFVRVGGYTNVVSAYSLVVTGSYAYLADTLAGVHVIDVSNPTNCLRVGGYHISDATGGAMGIAVAGNYAYVASALAGLQIIDVSNPTNCQRVGSYDTSDVSHGVVISGNYAYVADGEAGLQVIDVSNPAMSVRVGGYNTSGSAADVAVSEHYAYVADWYAGLQVIYVGNPTNCVLVGGFDTDGGARRVVLLASHAYVADDFAGMVVVDVSNPTNCVPVSCFKPKTFGGVYGIAATTDRTYVSELGDGLFALFSLPNLRFTVRVNATPSVPFTIEATTNLFGTTWMPLLTTNVAAVPFDFVDLDVKLTSKPQKFYRVHQP